MKEKSVLDELLFKPVLVKANDQERLVIIYGCDTVIEQSLNGRGKRNKKVVENVKLLDITKSIEFSQPVMETISITNPNRFKKYASIVSSRDYIGEIVAVTSMIVAEATRLNESLTNLSSIMVTIQSITNESLAPAKQEESEQGNLVLVGQTQTWAHIVFKALTGNQDLEKALSPKDVETIGGAIMEIISDHIHSDLNNEDTVRALKAEIEFKILNALPDNLRIGDIHLNMDAIVEEIKRFQDHHNGKDDTEEEQD